MKTRWKPLAALAVAGLALAACGGGGTGDGSTSSARSSTLVIAENEVPASFDPAQANNSTVDEVVSPIYDTLVDYDAANKLQNKLAESYKTSSDGKTITFTLRSGVTFHDGTPLTAKDVVFTLDRLKKIKVGVSALIGAYDSSTAPDDKTVVVTLSKPYSPFVPTLSRVYILNSALVTKNAGSDDGQAWLASHDAGSGPYKLDGYQTNTEAKFSQYPTYWGGFTKQAKSVVIRYLAESGTQRDALRSGDVDYAMDIATADLPSFESDSKFTVAKDDTTVQLYIWFNTQKGATADKKVREAVSYAYDYQSHVKDILAGNGSVAQGPLPSAMTCHADIPAMTQDLAKAKQLFQEAGVKTLSMTYLSAIEEMDRAATSLQSSLRQIGVDLKIQSITYPAYADLTTKVDTTPELGMLYAFPTTPDPSAVLETNYTTPFIGTQNLAAYSNPEVDKLVGQGLAASDQQQACAAYEQAQKVIENDYVAVNMADPKAVSVRDAAITGTGYRASHHSTVWFYGLMMS